ncbi:MAG: MBL fold metallo-hydrolase [Leucobacter sp.]
MPQPESVAPVRARLTAGTLRSGPRRVSAARLRSLESHCDQGRFRNHRGECADESQAPAAAMPLCREHRGDRAVKAVVYTHSHVDHPGGVRGVIDQAAVDRGRARRARSLIRYRAAQSRGRLT